MNKPAVSIVSDGPTTIEYVYRESAIKVDTSLIFSSHWNSTDVITAEGAGRVVVDIPATPEVITSENLFHF